MRIASLAAAALIIAGPATAGTVYSQDGTTACDPSCWTSHYGAGAGFQAFDNFRLDDAATITTVTWQGIYIPVNDTNAAPAPDTVSWNLGFYGDSGNFPGAAVYSTTLAAASVTTTFHGGGFFGDQPVNLYSFSATLPTGFAALANTTYWFSPLSLAPSFDPFFSWSPSTAVYDGLTAQTDTNGNIYRRSDDRAFSLGSTVPEPASWGLMIVGFGAVGLTARRRRTTVAA